MMLVTQADPICTIMPITTVAHHMKVTPPENAGRSD
jgi:hypothetical protein